LTQSYKEVVVIIPEVVGAIFVGHDDNGDLGIVFYRVDAVGCIGKVLLDIGG
jgi:hypothetical protein